MKKYTIVIDDDMPLAEKRPGKSSKYIHPLTWLLKKMAVGESLAYPVGNKLHMNRLRSYGANTGRKLGRKFATRQVMCDRGKSIALRFWRTA
jgi:hypothetical protein